VREWVASQRAIEKATRRDGAGDAVKTASAVAARGAKDSASAGVGALLGVATDKYKRVRADAASTQKIKGDADASGKDTDTLTSALTQSTGDASTDLDDAAAPKTDKSTSDPSLAPAADSAQAHAVNGSLRVPAVVTRARHLLHGSEERWRRAIRVVCDQMVRFRHVYSILRLLCIYVFDYSVMCACICAYLFRPTYSWFSTARHGFVSSLVKHSDDREG